MAARCFGLCQALVSQNRSFSLALTVGSFSFSLDTRELASNNQKAEKKMKKKKPSPSTIRRSVRRKEEFLKKKALTPPARTPSDSSGKKNQDLSSQFNQKSPDQPLSLVHLALSPRHPRHPGGVGLRRVRADWKCQWYSTPPSAWTENPLCPLLLLPITHHLVRRKLTSASAIETMSPGFVRSTLCHPRVSGAASQNWVVDFLSR